MAENEIFRKRVVYEVPGMNTVEIRREIVYGRAADGDLTLDVYLPPGLAPGERRPGVLFVHGGPIPAALWSKANKMGVFLSYGELLAASGMVAVTFNHRFVSMPEIAASEANVKTAIDFVRGQAPGFHLDPDRLAFWAFSGGGPFLAPVLRDRPAHLRALVAYYALLDLASVQGMVPQIPIPDDVARDFSAAASFPAGPPYDGPPILVARGGRDSTFINGTIDLFVQRALAANVPLDVMNHPAGQHGFDVLNDDDRSREIIARTIEFLKKHL
jgi:acetyl esterase/lipase